jgi:hypothetical protein
LCIIPIFTIGELEDAPLLAVRFYQPEKGGARKQFRCGTAQEQQDGQHLYFVPEPHPHRNDNLVESVVQLHMGMCLVVPHYANWYSAHLLLPPPEARPNQNFYLPTFPL